MTPFEVKTILILRSETDPTVAVAGLSYSQIRKVRRGGQVQGQMQGQEQVQADGRVLQELDCFAVVWSSRRDVAECQCGLAFVFSVPVTNCAACGRLGCNRSAKQLLYFPLPHLFVYKEDL